MSCHFEFCYPVLLTCVLLSRFLIPSVLISCVLLSSPVIESCHRVLSLCPSIVSCNLVSCYRVSCYHVPCYPYVPAIVCPAIVCPASLLLWCVLLWCVLLLCVLLSFLQHNCVLLSFLIFLATVSRRPMAGTVPVHNTTHTPAHRSTPKLISWPVLNPGIRPNLHPHNSIDPSEIGTLSPTLSQVLLPTALFVILRSHLQYLAASLLSSYSLHSWILLPLLVSHTPGSPATHGGVSLCHAPLADPPTLIFHPRKGYHTKN